ncbi:MAG: YegP family protein [Clostridia bacterium]|nr:YegP family protein [Clostridia bacterium]
MGKFVIRTVPSGVKFDMKAGNGEVIATSEVYRAKAACRAGIKSVMKNAAAAAVEDQTEESFAKAKNPKFEVYADKRGEFRFRLKATNGQQIAASEGYTTKAACLNGIESIRKNAAGAPIVEED